VGECLSAQAVWFGPTDKVRALDDQEILFVQGASRWEAHLRVEDAPPNSPERGKIAVIAWQAVIPDLENGWQEGVQIAPTKAAKYLESHPWQRFLTQDGLDLIRPRSSEWPEHIKLELVLPNEPESSGH